MLQLRLFAVSMLLTGSGKFCPHQLWVPAFTHAVCRTADCANSQPSCELVSSPISTASSPTTSGDTNSQEFAVPLPRSRPRPSSVVWNTAIRLELPGANSVSVTSVSLCSARMVVPSFCCDSGLPQRLMFDSLVKRQGVTLGRHQVGMKSWAPTWVHMGSVRAQPHQEGRQWDSCIICTVWFAAAQLPACC